MTLLTILALILGLAVLLLFLLAEAAFDAIFGYIGAGIVWLLTFGRIRMDPLRGGESILASSLGFLFTVLLVFSACCIFQRP